MPIQLSYVLYFVIEYIKMYVVTNLIFGHEFKKNIYLGGFIPGVIFFVVLSTISNPTKYPIGPGEFAALLMILSLVRKREFIYVGLYWEIISIVDTYNTTTLLFAGGGVKEFFSQITTEPIRNSISLIAYLIIYNILKDRNLTPVYLRGKKIIPPMILSLSLSGLNIATAYELSSGYNVTLKSLNVSRFLIIAAIVIYLVFFAFIIYQYNKTPRLIYERELTDYLLEEKIKYYRSLLEKDEEIRAFRHDIRSHFFSMKTLCNKGEYEQLAEYVREMDEKLNDLQKSHRSPSR